MRLGTESVGRWGLVVLAVTGALGVILAVHGWSVRSTDLPRVTLGASRPVSAPRTTQPPAQGPSSPAHSPSADHRPLLRAQPYANVAYEVWPGTPSAAAKAALTGLSVSVRRQGSALVIMAGVIGQAAPTPRRYAGGARVYVVESSLGDDSGNTDYNLGDDALVVTDAKGGIIQ
ncbi:MAG TPA: hypothetical protein VN695_01595 [Streptosporangiaceae bacterium]|nr:hypothetical protein [Streptosporangiaceae bacterium]